MNRATAKHQRDAIQEVLDEILEEPSFAPIGGPTVDVYQSGEDGAWVVHVDTGDLNENQDGPCPLRVYINDDIDDPAYANPPLKGET